MNRIALLTSTSLRHRWVAAQLATVAELGCVLTEAKPAQNQGASEADAAEIRSYLAERDRAEIRWFGEAPAFVEITRRAVELPWQGANTAETFALLRDAGVDRIVLFGSSIIRDPILSQFSGRIINMHLGLSPYYRGSATNYWPMVDGLPECVGVTVHHATAKVDGGGILAQARPAVEASDTVHDVGCKTIRAGAELLARYAAAALPLPPGAPQAGAGKLCRRADFGVESLRTLKSRMEAGLLRDYLTAKAERDARYPIIGPHSPLLQEASQA